MPAGRPTEYNTKILSKSKEYIESCVDVIENYHKTQGVKSDSYERIVNVNLPTIEGLALYLGVSRDTIYAWGEKYPQFVCIMENLRATQANKLINSALSGNYSAPIAKLLLAKHGYRDETTLTGPEGKPLTITFDPVFDDSQS